MALAPPRKHWRPSRRFRLASLSALLVAATLVIAKRAPATVAEQRQRLPPPAKCTDPIAGVWMSHDYRADIDRWGIITMELRRVSTTPPELRSRYHHDWWTGAPKESEPPPSCRPGLRHVISESTGEATYKAPKLEVRGTVLGKHELLCGASLPERALGVLTGDVDESIQEFQSTMTSRFGTYPIVWRRVRCFEDPAGPDPTSSPVVKDVAPPAVAPKVRDRSCGCGNVGAR